MRGNSRLIGIVIVALVVLFLIWVFFASGAPEQIGSGEMENSLAGGDPGQEEGGAGD
jgi:hypothetical protein